MDTEISAIVKKLDLIAEKLDLLIAANNAARDVGKVPITQAEFAEMLNKHPRTISRWVKQKKIRLENGLVPNHVVEKYLS